MLEKTESLSPRKADSFHLDAAFSLIQAISLVLETEEFTWMSDERFIPLKTLHPDEHNQLSGISLPGLLGKHRDLSCLLTVIVL